MARNCEVARKQTVLRGRAARESGPAREVMRAGGGKRGWQGTGSHWREWKKEEGERPPVALLIIRYRGREL